ncbi:Replicase [Donkey orchid symptomless virus]|uniref:Replicase n=1 Tax=Donkey orchid symptomless virus TaxID=1400526 RepID=V5LWR9_9VIRU|nr:Replicase [Donkey orchid symptomless virus]AHA56694.1 Replicase [Donkey orchid symptomless virus]
MLSEKYSAIKDVNQQAILQTRYRAEYDNAVNETRKTNPYYFDDASAEFLTGLGIPALPRHEATQLHRHGKNKAIENHLLANLKHKLSGPCSFCFFKPAKLQLLGYNPRTAHEFLNPHITAKDLYRFPEDNIVADVFKFNYPTAFVQDALHYYSPGIILNIFEGNPGLRELYATVVIPVEIMHKHASFHPSLYTIEYHDDDEFSYIPESSAAGAYTQGLACLNWLKYSNFSRGETKVSSTLLETLGAHHVLHFVRGEFLPQKRRLFQHPPLVKLPPVYCVGRFNSHKPFPKTLVQVLLLYAHTLKEIRDVDIWAKLRQQIPKNAIDDYDVGDLTLLADYVVVTAKLSRHPNALAISNASLLGRLSTHAKDALRRALSPFVGPDGFEEHQRQLQLQPFNYSIKTERYVSDHLPAALHAWIQNSDTTDLSRDELLELEACNSQVDQAPLSRREPDVPHCGANRVGDEVPPHHGVVIPPPELHDGLLPKLPSECNWGDSELESLLEQPIEQEPGCENHARASDIQNSAPAVHPRIIPIDDPYPRVEATAAIHIALSQHGPPSFTPYCSRCAADLASDLYGGRVGVINRWKNNAGLEQWEYLCDGERDEADGHVDHLRGERLARTRQVHTLGIMGTAGSGKSHSVQEYLRQHDDPQEYEVVVPTKELQADWRAKCPNMEHVHTFEQALTHRAARHLIIDEIGRYPPGYMSLLQTIRPNTPSFTVIGDPQQCVYHALNPEAKINHLPEEVLSFGATATAYLNSSKRCPKRVCDAIGAHCDNDRAGEISFNPVRATCNTLLTPQHTTAQALRELHPDTRTYAGSQGLTRRAISILLDTSTLLCDRRSIYTAITRATHHIEFVYNGPSADQFGQKLDAVPLIRALLETVHETPAPEHAPTDPVPVYELQARTHLPVENAIGTLDDEVAELADKHDRELFNQAGYSNCVRTNDPIIQAIPHQQRSDEALSLATFDYRLRRATVKENIEEVKTKAQAGLILYEHLAQALNLPAEPLLADDELWNQCRAETEVTYLMKPEHQISNARWRHEPDVDFSHIDLFIKSQKVKKPEKFGRKIKPGALICSYRQDVVLRTATLARYVRKRLCPYIPEHVFINCEKTPTQMEYFVTKHFRDGKLCLSNDYQAFDQSQDGGILNLERRVYTTLGVPAHEIDFYVDLKIHANAFTGVLGIMRLTGEGPTFDANTIANMAYFYTKYDVPIGTPAMFAGDDMTCFDNPTIRESWQHVEPMFSLTAKEELNTRPSFTGWLLSKHGIVKDPLKLLLTYHVAEQEKRTKDVLPSIAIDIDHAYSLGDKIFEVFDEREIRLHHHMLRRLHKNGFKPRSVLARNRMLSDETPGTLADRSVAIDVTLPGYARRGAGSLREPLLLPSDAERSPTRSHTIIDILT